jgi:hypothetical protein
MKGSGMQDVLIIDDAISPEKQADIVELMFGGYFGWHYQPSSHSYTTDEERPTIFPQANSVETPQFTHIFFNKGQYNSEFSEPIVAPLLSAIPYTIEQLVKVKANLVPFSPKTNADSCGAPHVDCGGLVGNITALYYVNDSDGETTIYNEQYGAPKNARLTVKQKVTPKKGRLVIFDGSLIHASGFTSSETPRVVININFVPYRAH